jgi:predicted TIM-barrel fold metal-dependent hydrolase
MAGNTDSKAAWLAQVQEEVIEPSRPIIDPHFHFFTGRGHEYLAADFLAMVATGHNVVGAVHVEANADFFADGGACGEMKFAVQQGAIARALQEASGRICDPVAGLVGYTDLRREDLGRNIDALMEAADGRLRGIRNSSAWDADPRVRNGHTNPPEGLLEDERLRRGVGRLVERGLVFETFLYFPQIPQLTSLARAVPDTIIVCDHLGGIIGVGPYAGTQRSDLTGWRSGITELAKCPNVVMKLGGVAMSPSGFGWHKRGRPLDSAEYATHYAPWFTHAIEAFGPERCMFESNFPVDGVSIAYPVLWNAFKRLARGYSEAEKSALFYGTAARTYRL